VVEEVERMDGFFLLFFLLFFYMLWEGRVLWMREEQDGTHLCDGSVIRGFEGVGGESG